MSISLLAYYLQAIIDFSELKFMCKLILIPRDKASFDIANLKTIISCMPAAYKPTLEDLAQFQYRDIVLDINKGTIDAAAIRMLNSLGRAFSIQYG